MLTTKEEQAVPSKLLTIGQLAKSTGQTVSTIRYWTKEGLLKVEKLSSGGYQLYSSSMIKNKTSPCPPERKTSNHCGIEEWIIK